MKKLILTFALILISSSLFAQRGYYYKNRYEKALTFQVSADIIDYDGLKYGWSIGANYKEIFSLNYFHVRDYVQAPESMLDSRFGGLHGSVLLPLNDCVQVGGGVRLPYLNRGYHRAGQSMTFSAEARLDLGASTKLAFEYGGSGSQNVTAIRLIWNLY